jgi:hypothetical protein
MLGLRGTKALHLRDESLSVKGFGRYENLIVASPADELDHFERTEVFSLLVIVSARAEETFGNAGDVLACGDGYVEDLPVGLSVSITMLL